MADESRDETTDRTSDGEETTAAAAAPAVAAPLGAAGGLMAGGMIGAGAGMGPGVAAAGPVAGIGLGLGLLSIGGGMGDDSDGEIAARVEEVLAGDGRIGSGGHIAVAVADATVELTGSVASERERQSAEEIIARVPGVRGVSNRLTVASGGTG